MLRCSILPILVCLTAWFLGALAMPIDAPLALQLGVRHIAGDSPLVLRGENTPLAPGRRDVWVPKIEVPTGTTVWHRGHVVTVEWCTKDAPKDISNGSAIYLRKGDSTLVENPLAKDFDLRTGHYNVTIPKNLKPGHDYRIVLFGDSGNWSEQFKIV